MSDTAKEEPIVETKEETKVETVPEVAPNTSTEAPPAPTKAEVAAEPAATTNTVAPEPVKEKPVEDAPKEEPVIESVGKVVDEFENMTIFGNKSLEELHQIQSKKSHLSAGRLHYVK